MAQNSNFDFQYAFGLVTGLLFGAFCAYPVLTFVYVILFEIIIFNLSYYENTLEFTLERVFINLAFLFGWILSRVLFLRESGLETCLRTARDFYSLA